MPKDPYNASMKRRFHLRPLERNLATGAGTGRQASGCARRRDAPGLRTAPVRGRGAHDGPRRVAGWLAAIRRRAAAAGAGGASRAACRSDSGARDEHGGGAFQRQSLGRALSEWRVIRPEQAARAATCPSDRRASFRKARFSAGTRHFSVTTLRPRGWVSATELGHG